MEHDFKQKSVSESLSTTVAKSGNLDLPAEIAEFAIDQVIDEGLLKDIPFVGWIAKGVSITNSISDRMFFQKILRFIFALEQVSKTDRVEYSKKIEEDPVFRKRVGEHLLVTIEKLDILDKPSFLAKCFDRFISGDIDHEYFVDLANVIERSTAHDLNALCVPENEPVIFRDNIAISSGLLVQHVSTNDDGETGEVRKLSNYSNDLRDIFMGRLPANYTKRVEREKWQEEQRLTDERWLAQREKRIRDIKSMQDKGKTDTEIMTSFDLDERGLDQLLNMNVYPAGRKRRFTER